MYTKIYKTDLILLKKDYDENYRVSSLLIHLDLFFGMVYKSLELSKITEQWPHHALTSMKNNKVPGKDMVLVQM